MVSDLVNLILLYVRLLFAKHAQQNGQKILSIFVREFIGFKKKMELHYLGSFGNA